MKFALSILALVAYAAAQGDYNHGRYAYQGRYHGNCGTDGLYYRDSKSFVFCSNGNSYVQPCAPGTRNSGYDRYASGGYYNQGDFCDVNLVDHGYAAHHSDHGYAAHHGYGPHFGFGYGRPYGYFGY